jgi:Kef-type K+ transport system membrane component KefB
LKKIVLYTSVLIIGLLLSQTLLPGLVESYSWVTHVINILTYAGLAHIMFFVGLEFQLDKNELSKYRTDYFVAFTAATFPWIFVSLYLLFAYFPQGNWTSFDAWTEVLFIGRFAAPTSAGILFAMLAAAGLAGTWVYKKIRILAIFDDLDTVLLLLPLKAMVIGFAWQLGFVMFIMVALIVFAWFYLRRIELPLHKYWPFIYSSLIALGSYGLYLFSKTISQEVPIHIEVLFPAFVLGLVVKIDKSKEKTIHKQETSLGYVGTAFMLLVGLNMPYVLNTLTQMNSAQWLTLSGHVLAITLLSNIGKLFVLFNYKDESTFKERLAVGIGMLPRGEVGAGVLVMAIGLGFKGPIITAAMASLILNLLLTGIFIYLVKHLSLPTQNVKQEVHYGKESLIEV